MAYGDFKDLPRTRPADKLLHDKVFNVTKKLKYDGYQRGIASMFYKFLWWISTWNCFNVLQIFW